MHARAWLVPASGRAASWRLRDLLCLQWCESTSCVSPPGARCPAAARAARWRCRRLHMCLRRPSDAVHAQRCAARLRTLAVHVMSCEPRLCRSAGRGPEVGGHAGSHPQAAALPQVCRPPPQPLPFAFRAPASSSYADMPLVVLVRVDTCADGCPAAATSELHLVRLKGDVSMQCIVSLCRSYI